jgi:hypothetical protein
VLEDSGSMVYNHELVYRMFRGDMGNPVFPTPTTNLLLPASSVDQCILLQVLLFGGGSIQGKFMFQMGTSVSVCLPRRELPPVNQILILSHRSASRNQVRKLQPVLFRKIELKKGTESNFPTVNIPVDSPKHEIKNVNLEP